MQTNALSRQVALLAEPKNPLDSTTSTSSGFFYTPRSTAMHYTLKRYPLAYKFYRTRAITSVVYGRNAENEPVSRIKMADYRSMGTL